MRVFKIIDALISIGLIVLFIRLFRTDELRDDEFYMAYMITGLWQILSMFVHIVNKKFVTPGGIRFFYHRFVAYYLPSIWLAAIIIHWSVDEERYTGIWSDGIDISSTIMAVFYTALCCIELI